MKEIIINHFLDYEFVYIFLFSSLFLLLISIFVKNKIIRIISIFLFSILFVLLFFEIILSFVVSKNVDFSFNDRIMNVNHSRKIVRHRQLFVLDKKTGEEFVLSDSNISDKSFDDENYLKIWDMNFSTFEKTFFRYTKCNEFSKEAYVFLGCSFVFGEGVSDDETLPYYFSNKLDFKYNVINYGIAGKGSNTALSILNTGLNKNIQYKHFFFSLISDLIYRNFRLYHPNDKFLFVDDKVKKVSYPYFKLVDIFKRSYIFRKVFLPQIEHYNRKFYDYYMIKSLEYMNKIVEEKYNSKLTILVWPDKYNKPDKYSEIFMKKLKEANLDLIFLPEYFNDKEKEYRIKNDVHPTAKANEEIAEILYNHIR